MIFKSTDEFYKHLVSDYRDKAGSDKDVVIARKLDGIDDYAVTDKKVRRSFLYIYFKEKKVIDARRISRDKDLLFKYRAPKKDKYTLLVGAHMACKGKIISDKDYKEIFLEVNACSKSGQKKREKLFDTNPDEARKQLEDRLLRDCAERFIDNALRRVNNSNIDEIKLLHEFNKYDMKINGSTNDFADASPSDFSEEYIQKCADLYEIIRSGDDMTEVLVPLYIDKDSGAGIYIIGNTILDTDSPKVCVLSFYGVEHADKEEEPYYIPISMKYTEYNSVESAFLEFENNIINGIYFDDYSEYNGDELPDGADECFKLRFLNEMLRERIIRQNNEDEAKGIEDMNNKGYSSAP